MEKEKIKAVRKGGNSPVRFFLMIGDEKIGMIDSRSKICVVDVYNKQYMAEIQRYMFEEWRAERFSWGYMP